VKVLVVLGVHPAELTKYYGRLGLARAVEMMKSGLFLAREYVDKGLAVGLKSGRPHYEVEPKLWDASNHIMRYSFELAKDAGCAVQLHTESATEERLSEIGEMARSVGLAPDKVVKHFSPPMVNICEKHGIFPSVLAGEGARSSSWQNGERRFSGKCIRGILRTCMGWRSTYSCHNSE